MFVITVTYLKSLDEVDKYLVAHREHLKKGYAQNLLLASGPQIPRQGGIILTAGNDKNKILNFIENDPFKLNGVASYNIVEFDPVLSADGIANLLK